MKKIEHNYQSIEGWFNMENQYLELLNHCPDGGVFVELGCFKGKSTSFIVTEIVNQNRDVKFITFDSFQGHTNSNDKKEVEAYNGIGGIYLTFVKNTIHLEDKFFAHASLSHEAAKYFDDNSIDCLFIDAGHSYEAVKKDIEAWLPKMKANGIMAGHDYMAWAGVNKAVQEKFGKPHKVENDCWFIYLDKL
jgi:hypothetical protein